MQTVLELGHSRVVKATHVKTPSILGDAMSHGHEGLLLVLAAFASTVKVKDGLLVPGVSLWGPVVHHRFYFHQVIGKYAVSVSSPVTLSPMELVNAQSSEYL